MFLKRASTKILETALKLSRKMAHFISVLFNQAHLWNQTFTNIHFWNQTLNKAVNIS